MAAKYTFPKEGNPKDPEAAHIFGSWESIYPNDYLARKKWDYAIAFQSVSAEDPTKQHLQVERRQIVKRIKAAGLTVSKLRSTDDKTIFYRIAGDQDLLEHWAETTHMRMKVKEGKYGGGFDTFVVAKKAKFEGAGDRFFRSAERIRLIRTILDAERQDGGAEIGLRVKENDGVILGHFALHDEDKRQFLMEHWVKKFFKPQPMEEIRLYFGEQIGMYFGFLGFYTFWIWWLLVAGIVTAYFQYTNYDTYTYTDSSGTETTITYMTYDGILTPAYVVFICVAITFLIEGWKRRQSKFAHDWDMQDFEKTEVTRPEYIGKDKKGFWTHENDWVPLDKELKKLKDEGEEFPEAWTEAKYGAKRIDISIGGYIGMTSMIVTVIIGAFALLVFKAFIGNLLGSYAQTLIGGMCFTAFIQITNMLYRKIAQKLNDRENHRTDTIWDDAFIAKVSLFQFVNSYVSYFFIAFVKVWDLTFFGVEEVCQSSTDDAPANCMYELHEQLMSVFAFQVLCGNVIEVFIPFMKRQMKAYKSRRRVHTKGENLDEMRKSSVQKQFESSAYENPFDDYAELVVQFGYITLFSVTFPLAAVLALANNLIEIRSDAYKLLSETRRPFPNGAQDIGTWANVLQIMSYVAVLTNMGVLAFVSSEMDRLTAGFAEPLLWKLGIVVILEHLVFMMMYIIGEAIPDVPYSVRVKAAKSEFLRELHEKKDTYVKHHPGASIQDMIAATKPFVDVDPGEDTDVTDKED